MGHRIGKRIAIDRTPGAVTTDHDAQARAHGVLTVNCVRIGEVKLIVVYEFEVLTFGNVPVESSSGEASNVIARILELIVETIEVVRPHDSALQRSASSDCCVDLR